MEGKPDRAAPQPLRILVLDDDLVSRLVLTEMLRSLDHLARELESADEAIDCAASGEFDVLLVDLSMPGADGFEILRRLRAREAADDRAPLPVIAVTGHVDAEDHARTRSAGFAAHLDKPVILGTLNTTLTAAVARSRSPSCPPPGGPAPASAASGASNAERAPTDPEYIAAALSALTAPRSGDARLGQMLAHAFADRTAQLLARLDHDALPPAARADAADRLHACAWAVGAHALADRCRETPPSIAALRAEFEHLAAALLRTAALGAAPAPDQPRQATERAS